MREPVLSRDQPSRDRERAEPVLNRAREEAEPVLNRDREEAFPYNGIT
jgi:hypothetical protein